MGTNLGDLLKQAGLKDTGTAEPEPDAEPSGPTGPRFAPKVVVRRTRKGHGGRTVCVVSGVQDGHDEVLTALKKQLGCGARRDGDDLVVQGDQVDRVADWLEQAGAKRVVRS